MKAKEFFYENIRPLPGLTHMEKKSEAAMTGFDDHSLDAVYIDGNHSEEAFALDFKGWYNKIKQGGWLCGHDYSWDSVKGFILKEGYTPKLYKGDHWAIQIC